MTIPPELLPYTKPIPCLDKGHIRLVDVMGDDYAVVQAARVSYGKGLSEHKLERRGIDLVCKVCGKVFADDSPAGVVVPEKPGDPGHCLVADRGLIRYLHRHRHSTPLEMCEIKLHVRIPMDAWRQYVRHRTACLSGATVLHFDLPGGIERRGNQRHNMTVRDFYERWCREPTGAVANLPALRDRLSEMHLRSVDETTGAVRHTHVVDIWESGEKVVYRVVLENGAQLECSADHRILLDSGEWKTLKEIVSLKHVDAGDDFPDWGMRPLCIVSGGGTGVIPHMVPGDEGVERWAPVVGWEDWYEVSDQGRVRRIVGGRGAGSFGRCKALTLAKGRHVVSLNRPGRQETVHVAVLVAEAFLGSRPPEGQCCHKDGNSLNNRVENLRWGTAASNASDRVRDVATTHLRTEGVKIVRVDNIGRMMTYDLEVEGPWHNFCAGGVIVHNSINEFSTRYSEVPLVDDDGTFVGLAETPPDQWRLQSASSKQGSDGFLPGAYGVGLTKAEHDLHQQLIEVYQQRLKHGVAKEQARKDLPLSTYTEAYWKIDLHNLLHFLSLRLDRHAQLEIRTFAEAIAQIVRAWVPMCWEAFVDYQLEARTFSRMELVVLREMVAVCAEAQGGADQNRTLMNVFKPRLVELGMSERERREFWVELGVLT